MIIFLDLVTLPLLPSSVAAARVCSAKQSMARRYSGTPKRMSVRVPHCQGNLLSLSRLLLKPVKTGRHRFANVLRQQDMPSICSCEPQATARTVQTVVLSLVQVHYNCREASLLYTSVCCTTGAGLQVLDCRCWTAHLTVPTEHLATPDKGWPRALPYFAAALLATPLLSA